MCDRDRKLLAIILLLRLKKMQKKNKKKLWKRKIKRAKMHQLIVRTLKCNELVNLGMNYKCFCELLSVVRPHIKRIKLPHSSIKMEEQLLVTLRFLASGCSFENLTLSCLAASEIRTIVVETCSAIYKGLRSYIKMPSSEQEWKQVVNLFETNWNFKNCAGALGGKHIAIEKPDEDESEYLNYKQFHSIIILAIVDANHQFLFVEVGNRGGLSHPPVLRYTNNFFEKLIEESLGLPSPSSLTADDVLVPYVFVADNAAELMDNVMTPYRPPNGLPEIIYNYRLSRARRVFENAFGILYSRFGLFRKSISVNIDDVNKIALTCCALHNFLCRHNEEYISEELLDRENLNSMAFQPAVWRLTKKTKEWRDTHPMTSICHVIDDWLAHDCGEVVRKKFKTYFSNEGQLSFQGVMATVAPE